MASKVYVGGLPYSTTSDELREKFGGYGTVVSADVIMDRTTGQSRGFGFVEMSSEEEAKKAIDQLNGQELGGRRLKVDMASPQTGGGNGGGRGKDAVGGGRWGSSRW
jgi:RNA recognition motif-containing protein